MMKLIIMNEMVTKTRQEDYTHTGAAHQDLDALLCSRGRGGKDFEIWQHNNKTYKKRLRQGVSFSWSWSLGVLPQGSSSWICSDRVGGRVNLLKTH